MPSITLRTSVALLAWCATVSYAQDVLTLAVKGGVTPDGNGVLGYVSIHAINEGAAAYSGLTTGNPGGANNDFILATVTRKGAELVFREGKHTTHNGTLAFSSGQISVNSRGEVAFIGGLQNTSAGTLNDEGIYSALGASITEIARENLPEPKGGTGVFNSFGTPTINASGRVAFWGAIRNAGTSLFSTHGIFIGNGASLKQIARTYTPSPDGNGEFSGISSTAVVSESGHVAFRADLRATTAGDADNSGIYCGNGTTLTAVARENDPSPDGNGRLDDINFPSINDNGRVAFYTRLRNTRGGASDNIAIFLGSGSGLIKIARTGEPAPDGNGHYTSLGNSLTINTAGDVVFTAALSTGKQAVIWSNGVMSKIVARSGDFGPDGSYTFTGFTAAAINKTRTVTFQADLSYGLEQRGIYMSDGEDIRLVAKTGDTLGGSTISYLGFDPKAFNNFAEIAFQAILADGKWGVFLFSPKVKWRRNENGSWENAARWTTSLLPAGYVQVDIDPPAGAVVNGPTIDTEIRSLSVGTTSTGTVELNLLPEVRLTVLEGAVIGESGKLTGKGRIIGNVTNRGEVSPGNSPGSIWMEGDYTQLADGSLRLELGGPAAGNYDQLQATGNVSLAGTLRIVLIDGFTPSPGSSFTLVSAGGSISGAITHLIVPETPGITWQLTQTTHQIILKAVSAKLVSFRTSFGLNSDGSDDKTASSTNGIPNLLHFLMGLGDPRQTHVPTLQLNELNQGITLGLPVLKPNGNNGWSFSFVKRQESTGYDYVVEVSKNLSAWSDIHDEDAGYAPVGLTIHRFDDDYNVWTLFFNRRTDPTFLRVRSIL